MSRGDTEDIESEAEEFEVEAIKEHSKVNGETLYFVKWKGYSNSENTWEPAANLLGGAQDILDQYWADQKEKKNKTKKKTTKPKSRKRPNKSDDDDDNNNEVVEDERPKRTRKKMKSPSPIFSEVSLGSDDDEDHHVTTAKSDTSDYEEDVIKKRPRNNKVNYNELEYNDEDEEDDQDYELNSAEGGSDKTDSVTDDQLIEEEDDDDEYEDEEKKVFEKVGNDNEKEKDDQQQSSSKSNTIQKRNIEVSDTENNDNSDIRNDEDNVHETSITNSRLTRKAATNLYFGFNGLTEELRNLGDEEDVEENKKIDDDEYNTDLNDVDTPSYVVSLTMEDNGSSMKFEVIVDSKYIDSSLTWEKDVEKIINVYQDEEEHRYQGVVKWSNGTYSLHPNDELRKKCPQQLIDFYENHLYFRSS